MTDVTGASGSRMSADQTEYARGKTTMGEVGGGDDEPAKIDVRTRRRGGRHRWASPRAPSMSLCRTVEDEEEAGEVDADVEVEACGRRAVGDSISSSARVKNRGITKKTNQQQLV